MILCCGESLIDMVPENGMYRPLSGGSVYNTAVALGRLGARTGFLWPFSQDTFAAMLRGPDPQGAMDVVGDVADGDGSHCLQSPGTIALLSI